MSSLSDKLNKAIADARKRKKPGTAKPASASAPAATPATAATPAPAPAAKPATTPDAPVDYASALKDQRTKLAEAEQEVSKQLGAGTPQELDAAKARLSTLQSSVKTLEDVVRQAKFPATPENLGALQEQSRVRKEALKSASASQFPGQGTTVRSLLEAQKDTSGLQKDIAATELKIAAARRAMMKEKGAKPIDAPDEAFTVASPRRVYGGLATVPVAEMDEASRGQLFRAGGKSPKELAEAAKKLREEAAPLRTEIRDTNKYISEIDAFLEQIKKKPEETGPEYQERLPEDYKGLDDVARLKLQRTIAMAEREKASLESQKKAQSERMASLERALILTGSAAPAVVAAKAQEQREEAKVAEPSAVTPQSEPSGASKQSPPPTRSYSIPIGPGKRF